MPTTKLPISAIVVFRNEAPLLEGCLEGLWFCDQLILVDMQSSDGSRQIARRYSRQILGCSVEPTADPVRVWATQFARHPYILIVDPDEHYPRSLGEQIGRAIEQHPEAGGFRLPWRYYFKGKYMPGTIWGGTRLSKLVLIHRDRGQLLPTCNHIIQVQEGYQTITLENEDENHIRHYWSNSYRALLGAHLKRYPPLDAKRMALQGAKVGWRELTIEPLRLAKRSYVDLSGWKMGWSGLALSMMFGAYHYVVNWTYWNRLRRTRRQGKIGPEPLPHYANTRPATKRPPAQGPACPPCRSQSEDPVSPGNGPGLEAA